MYLTNSDLRNQVETLAEMAFHRQLISGYGDGEYEGKYQIMYQGKPRHFPLMTAYFFLSSLLEQHQAGFHLQDLAISGKRS